MTTTSTAGGRLPELRSPGQFEGSAGGYRLTWPGDWRDVTWNGRLIANICFTATYVMIEDPVTHVVTYYPFRWIIAPQPSSGRPVRVMSPGKGEDQLIVIAAHISGPYLVFTKGEWDAFTEGAEAGEFDFDETPPRAIAAPPAGYHASSAMAIVIAA